MTKTTSFLINLLNNYVEKYLFQIFVTGMIYVWEINKLNM